MNWYCYTSWLISSLLTSGGMQLYTFTEILYFCKVFEKTFLDHLGNASSQNCEQDCFSDDLIEYDLLL